MHPRRHQHQLLQALLKILRTYPDPAILDDLLWRRIRRHHHTVELPLKLHRRHANPIPESRERSHNALDDALHAAVGDVFAVFEVADVALAHQVFVDVVDLFEFVLLGFGVGFFCEQF